MLELMNSKDNEGISEDEVVAIDFCWEDVVCWFTALICIFELEFLLQFLFFSNAMVLPSVL